MLNNNNAKNGRANGAQPKKKGNGNGGNGRNGGTNGSNGVLSSIVRRSTNIPAAFASENRRAMNNNMVTLSGSDFLTTVTVGPITTVADRILLTMPVSPSAYPGTRITQLSELWERYRFRKFAFRFVPAVPVTLACQLALYVDLDPLDDPTTITDADTLVRQAVAQTGSQQWNFNLPKTIELAKRGDDQLYYTGEDKQNLRFSQQGTGYLIQVTEPVSSEGTPITTDLVAGSIFIDWAVTFQTPQINPEAAVAIPFNAATGATDITGETYTGEYIYLAPAIPYAKYVVTIGGTGPVTSGQIYIGAPGTPFGNVLTTTGTVRLNVTGGNATPGYIIAQANEDGEIPVYITSDLVSTSILINTTLLTYRDDVFATAAVASLFNKPGRYMRMKTLPALSSLDSS